MKTQRHGGVLETDDSVLLNRQEKSDPYCGGPSERERRWEKTAELEINGKTEVEDARWSPPLSSAYVDR